MSILNSVLKIFIGDKTKKDLKKITPIVKEINNYQKKLPVLDDDTKNIIEYVEQKDTKKKKFNFWKLLESDD